MVVGLSLNHLNESLYCRQSSGQMAVCAGRWYRFLSRCWTRAWIWQKNTQLSVYAGTKHTALNNTNFTNNRVWIKKYRLFIGPHLRQYWSIVMYDSQSGNTCTCLLWLRLYGELSRPKMTNYIQQRIETLYAANLKIIAMRRELWHDDS
jgi:hypothetical protein